MRHKRITLWRLTVHEFRRALRVLAPEIPRIELFQLLLEKRNKEMARFLRATAILLVGVLYLGNQSSAATVDLTLLTLSIRIPTSYVLFFLSFLFVSVSITIQNYFMLNEFMRIYVNQHMSFDNSTAFAVPYDGSSASVLGTQIQFRFFKSSWPHSVFSFTSAVLFLAPMALVVCFLCWALLSAVLQVLFNKQEAPFASVLASASLPLLMYPIVNVALQSIPFKFEKNTQFIRWNFLLKLHRRDGFLPIRIHRWT